MVKFSDESLGVADVLVSPHWEYQRLGADEQARQSAYFALFEKAISERNLNEIRRATNKAWVLGDDLFRERIEAQLNRRAQPLERGGDRKSVRYRESNKINGV